MSRMRFVVAVGGCELTYIGRTISTTFFVEALVVRDGADKDMYKFRVESAQEAFVSAGKDPRKTVNCEFSLIKTDPMAELATIIADNKPPQVVSLASDWYKDLAA